MKRSYSKKKEKEKIKIMKKEVAASLLNQSADSALSGDGVLPPLGQLLTQAPSTPTSPSRLPGR
jgi:hypothetical protein